ncbi:MAG TPA: beta-ketoacyl-[acyl-carrier-protein] synthase family protein [Burkholderiales bacterium]
MPRRVAVTGLGLIGPHGGAEPGGAQAAFEALMAGQSAVTLWDHPAAAQLNAPAAVAPTPFDASHWFTRLQLAGVDRFSQFAVAAAELARADAGLAAYDAATGVYLGSGMGGAAAIEDAYASAQKSGRVSPLTVPATMPNAGAAHIAMRNGLHGPVYTYSIACASSAVAIAEAAKAIAAGELDCAIAGGSEALLLPGVIRAWQAMHTLAEPAAQAERSSRPFAVDRAGLVLGEGAAVLVLEPLEAARARGARLYAEIAGSGVSCDATHLTKPDTAGQVRALTMALARAGLAPAEVGYCNAHGTATQAGDMVEAASLAQVWGEALPQLAVSSTKSMHGHLLGAAGALEAAITVLALYNRALPPSMFCEMPDPECALALVHTPGTQAPELKAAISNSFAFGGTNVVLAFRRAE